MVASKMPLSSWQAVDSILNIFMVLQGLSTLSRPLDSVEGSMPQHRSSDLVVEVWCLDSGVCLGLRCYHDLLVAVLLKYSFQ